MNREPPKVSEYLDISEKRRAYKRHIAVLGEIISHPPAVNSGPPPTCGRIVEYEKHRARNRRMQLEAEAENMRAIKEIHRLTQEKQLAVRKSAPVTRSPYNWTSKLEECEKQLSMTSAKTRPQTSIKLMFPSEKKTTSHLPKRVISDSGMTVIDDGPSTAKHQSRSALATTPMSPNRTKPSVFKPNNAGNKTINNQSSPPIQKAPLAHPQKKAVISPNKDQTPRKKKDQNPLLRPITPNNESDQNYMTSASDFGEHNSPNELQDMLKDAVSIMNAVSPEEERKKQEEEKQKLEEERRKEEAEKAKRAEEEKKRKEEEKRKKAEKERKQKEEEERKRKEEERKRKEEEERKRKEEEERKRKEEEEEEARRKLEDSQGLNSGFENDFESNASKENDKKSDLNESIKSRDFSEASKKEESNFDDDGFVDDDEKQSSDHPLGGMMNNVFSALTNQNEESDKEQSQHSDKKESDFDHFESASNDNEPQEVKNKSVTITSVVGDVLTQINGNDQNNESTEKEEKDESSEKEDKNESSEKEEKNESSEKEDKNESSEKEEQNESSEKEDKNVSSEKEEQNESSEKGEQNESSEKEEQNESSEKEDKNDNFDDFDDFENSEKKKESDHEGENNHESVASRDLSH